MSAAAPPHSRVPIGFADGKKTLLVLLGPTAVGKTELALALAEAIGSPILNADSRQLYRDLRIGTAAPTAKQLARVRHYFVGTLDITDYYSAARYEAEVLNLCEDLFHTHDTLILSGGSMMYIDAVCNGIDDIPTVEPEVRDHLRQRYEAEGLTPLAAELRLLDPEYYATVDLRNPKRIIHALEICYQTGRTFTSFRTATRKPRPFRIVKVGLRRERADLFDRINRRVDAMMQQGFLEEVRALLPYRTENALNTVGYKELFQVLDGTWELPFAVEKIKKNTRVYAKKQMTWFAHDPAIHWFTLPPSSPSAITPFASSPSSSAITPSTSSFSPSAIIPLASSSSPSAITPLASSPSPSAITPLASSSSPSAITPLASSSSPSAITPPASFSPSAIIPSASSSPSAITPSTAIRPPSCAVSGGLSAGVPLPLLPAILSLLSAP